MTYQDHMISAITEDGQIRAFAVTTRDLVEEARRRHGTMNVATAALGRTLSAGLLMSPMLKNDQDLLSIEIRGDGPLGGITVTVDSHGNVKGYVLNPLVQMPLNERGHLDVGGAVGKGTLTVIRDLNLKETHSGTVELHSGEIAEDLTWYFAESEQVPSSVGLGVRVAPDHHVLHAGGFLIQLMPGATEETICTLEENLAATRDVTEMMDSGMTLEEILKSLLSGFEVRFTGTMPVQFHCSCSRQRVLHALALLGKDELQEIVRDQKPQELVCHFCGERYEISVREMEEILQNMKKS
ncbi:MAG: Hsp33 family molecular chaperone HslO [Anaerovoracaceae bacterium]|jgi:molecular chaperone Hsp33